MKIVVLILLIALGLLQYQLWFGQGGLQHLYEIYRGKEIQTIENRRLEERNEGLAAEAADLQQGLEAIEERARSEMGMIKNNETFYQIINEPKNRADKN
jgi:cell division protein FtsB